MAPVVAYWLSVPMGARVRPLEDDERARLRLTARKTWRYFDTFVTATDSWLPPDNVQEVEGGLRVARRTSPTNIAMSMLSAMAAHDLGYLSTDDLVRRLDATVRTLEGLERYRGHFLNWYDTATLAPLHPRYVSTVDSGNLAASLIALAQGLVDLEKRPQTIDQRLEGLTDTTGVLAAVSRTTENVGAARETVTEVNRAAREILAALRGDRDAEVKAREISSLIEPLRRAIELPSPSRFGEAGPPSQPSRFGEAGSSSSDLPYWIGAVVAQAERLGDDRAVPLAALTDLARRISALADSMRFDFLYDRRRRIFAIGYRLADAEGPGRLDDVLLRFARLGSAAGQLRRDRQRRRAAASLVPSRPPGDQRRAAARR